MTTNGRARLSPQAYKQIRDELDRLLLTHRTGSRLDADADADADEAGTAHRWRPRRIRCPQELPLTADIGAAPPDDRVVELGMELTARFDDSLEEESVLLADGPAATPAGLEVCSSASPPGRALLGACEGQTRVCRLPDGRTVSMCSPRGTYRHRCPSLA